MQPGKRRWLPLAGSWVRLESMARGEQPVRERQAPRDLTCVCVCNHESNMIGHSPPTWRVCSPKDKLRKEGILAPLLTWVPERDEGGNVGFGRHRGRE